jgi:hypothetical protein
VVRALDAVDGVAAGDVTIASLWGAVVDLRQVEGVVAWPPDLFALVDRALEASETYRFVVSPPLGTEFVGMGPAASAAAVEWWRWLDGDGDLPPESVLRWWEVVRDAMDVRVADLAAGGSWPVTMALLALHAIADEACAGLGTSTAVAPGPGGAFRALARELLAETGSLSRISPGALRVIPRCRASSTGMSIGSLSRHVSVRGPQVDVDWHRMLSMPTGVDLPEEHANVLLLPWPLRVRARDFRPAAYTLPQMDAGDAGFFEFEPGEPFDLELVDGVLRAAIDEAGTVDAVFLPEAAITSADLEPLEALLGEHGVWCLIAGVRERGTEGHLGSSWVHVGVRHEIVWRHATQHKHHRWSLDRRQIQQYHLGGALSPSMRWWEAVSIPRRSLQVIDQGAVTITPLLCEDLARLEPVADLVRSIGPSLVVTLLLDGPQLASRWTARYASVLADDPGSAVCTLTSYGMVQRCRPPGCAPSRVVALWKDATGDLTEIELEEGAEGVLIATHVTVGDSLTADGRRHPGTTSTLTLAAVHSIQADPARPEPTVRSLPPPGQTVRPDLRSLNESEVSKATSWAEAFAEAAVVGPESLHALMVEATTSAWRPQLGLPAPSRLFVEAVEMLRREMPSRPTIDDLLAAAGRLRHSSEPAAIVTGTLIEIALQQRLFGEVQARRLPVAVLASLVAPRVPGEGWSDRSLRRSRPCGDGGADAEVDEPGEGGGPSDEGDGQGDLG